MQSPFEKVKEGFLVDKLIQARSKTWDCVHEIAEGIRPGMLESQAQVLANQVIERLGCERHWHKVHVRFGINTTLGYSEKSLPGVRLQERDIFFIDIGPVWEGYEGDAGSTFVFGEDAEMHRCAKESKDLFDRIRERWKVTGETGKDLYRFAVGEAAQMGWEFQLSGASGHRISDFPHAAYHRGDLRSLESSPTAHRWVLEVQLRHPSRPFGSFFEDVLS
jgi:Xaa-Pro aminopeptidase